mgnify:CR=1 FL=1
MSINYGMCWEDPVSMLNSLQIKRDDIVVSIVSGGENTIAICLKRPKRVFALDSNIEQINLLKDKLIRYSPDLINKGKFENILSLFRNNVLRKILSKSDIIRFSNLYGEEQRVFFDKKIKGDIWDKELRKILDKYVSYSLKDKFYMRISKKKIINEYIRRIEDGFRNIDNKNNYFSLYILTGKIDNPYLNKISKDSDNIKKIISFYNEDFLSFIKSQPDNSINKFNLSNIFEYMPYSQYLDCLKEIKRVGKNGAIICYWNNIVKRHRTISGLSDIKSDDKKDRIFFYDKMIVQIVNK